VKEEVVVQKTANQRTENVQDTVRETKVDVDDGGRDRSRNR
jgi:stress response protein YsnF